MSYDDPDTAFDGTYGAEPALSFKKIREDAEAFREKLAPCHDEPLRSDLLALINLLRNQQDYFQAHIEQIHAELRRNRKGEDPKARGRARGRLRGAGRR